MERRDFLKATAATAGALAMSGHLPLLAAGKTIRKKRGGSLNIFTEPCAIEPVTGHLKTFSPTKKGSMRGAFSASYTLLYWTGAGETSKNADKGTMDVMVKEGTCRTTEKRQGNTIKGLVHMNGPLGTASKWTLDSSFSGPATRFIEKGVWDGKRMVVESKTWTQKHTTGNPLIAKWAILPLVASGSLKKSGLNFDLLDDSTLRPNQELRYEGEIVIPVKGGKATLDSYVQTGQAIQPTHYLVDKQGRVQLITASMVNWVLKDVKIL